MVLDAFFFLLTAGDALRGVVVSLPMASTCRHGQGASEGDALVSPFPHTEICSR